MGPIERRQSLAWILLVAATFLSFWVAGHFAAQLAAIAASMSIAAAKVIVILRQFMHSDRLAPPMRIYFLVWTIGCTAMIVGIAAWPAFMA